MGRANKEQLPRPSPDSYLNLELAVCFRCVSWIALDRCVARRAATIGSKGIDGGTSSQWCSLLKAQSNVNYV